jgi:hypothetical protein
MKVKELIKLLSELDQEKEVKTVNVDYEQGAEAEEICEVRLFEPNGNDSRVYDYGGNKDFYIVI